jgi:hypothetical protein
MAKGPISVLENVPILITYISFTICRVYLATHKFKKSFYSPPKLHVLHVWV